MWSHFTWDGSACKPSPTSCDWGSSCTRANCSKKGVASFGPKSKAFPDPEQRGRARELAKAQGVLLEKNWPLGYGGLELGVVFNRGCPNNTVPISWAEASNPKWMPLFRRA